MTGYNEAFIIDKKTRDALIQASPKNGEIIRPILRGRDIKKYTASFADQYIINTHNGSKNGAKAINAKNDYPAIFEHLQQYETALAKRQDKGQHWSNLRNCAYLEDLEKEKIIWIELTDHPNFTLDKTGIYLNNTIFFMTGLHLKYLLTYLNSRLCEWYFDKIAATSGVGTRRWIKIYIDQICAIKPNPILEEEMNMLADKALKNNSKETLKEIDLAFYKLFDLDSDQIDVVEKANL
ncbi:TaqI-like C-terminal specificity domain-containing protein [Pedobacter psychrotolerans]|uniref:site-specific DNA-methyltransferase (adenine-specific) n=1 Tax=Pedobacter psychrotolerans TaxID=1843235 RepID=A0ABQ1SIC3_9SPHI|nr:TaqI-like C-terminal specificity domain-containing protein [Pedobacter psychrotolerans]GGE41479.1 hypothetical protein GCM10011413_04200 [Pedobacter psychrotolerans]